LSDPDKRAAALSRIPSGRFATPEEIAAAVVYLASPGAASVTGHTLPVDGGLTAVERYIGWPDRACAAAEPTVCGGLVA